MVKNAKETKLDLEKGFKFINYKSSNDIFFKMFNSFQ